MDTTITTATAIGTTAPGEPTVPTRADLAAVTEPYLRDPDAIYARSFQLIRAEVDLDRFPDTGVGEMVGHIVAVRFVGQSFADLGEIVLAISIVDMG